MFSRPLALSLEWRDASLGLGLIAASSHTMSAALLMHVTTAGILVASASGSLALVSEACNQVVDALPHASAAQNLLEAIWHRLGGGELAFGAVRLSVLLRFSAAACAAAVALFILLEALLELGIGRHGSCSSVSASAAAAAAVAGVVSLAPARLGKGTAARSTEASAKRLGLRATVLLLAAYLGKEPLSAEAVLRAQPGEAAARAGGSLAELTAMAPPLLRIGLTMLLRCPDASAGALLAILAIMSAVADAAAPGALLLQTTGRDLVPDLAARIARARCAPSALELFRTGAFTHPLTHLLAHLLTHSLRRAPGIVEVRDVQLWLLDEQSAVGSLVAVVRPDADPQVSP